MEEFLRQRYFDYVDDLDPYRDKSEDPETLEEILYNLICMKEDFIEENDPEGYEVLTATIEQFKAAGVEII